MPERHQEDSHLSTADIARGNDDIRTEDGWEDGRTEDRSADSSLMPLLPANEADSFRSRWDSIQAEFVDNPHTSVEAADSLVAEVMKRLAEVFTEEREKMESQWRRDDDFSTEDLRVALQRYRSFFNRLLTLR